jgi:hypothetical protein
VIVIALLVVAIGSGRTPVTSSAFHGTTESGQAGTRAARAQDTKCIRFSSEGRLRHDAPFTAAFPNGLELRLHPDGDFGWDIAVRRRVGSTVDYMWVVSPPFQTSPQRKIGPGYGLSAHESASFARDLRFVLTDADYEAAVKIIRENQASPEKMAAIDQLGKGTLSIEIARFGLRSVQGPGGVRAEALDWIEFKGEACVPR